MRFVNFRGDAATLGELDWLAAAVSQTAGEVTSRRSVAIRKALVETADRLQPGQQIDVSEFRKRLGRPPDDERREVMQVVVSCQLDDASEAALVKLEAAAAVAGRVRTSLVLRWVIADAVKVLDQGSQ